MATPSLEAIEELIGRFKFTIETHVFDPDNCSDSEREEMQEWHDLHDAALQELKAVKKALL